MPVALHRAIRFAAGTRLVFMPALGEPLLAALTQVKPQHKAFLDTLPAASCIVASIDADRCTIELVVGDATCDVHIKRDTAETYAVSAEYRAHTDDMPRVATYGALRLMLGGASEVFLAEHGAHDVRYWLKLRYGTDQQRVGVSLFTAGLVRRLPLGLRALVPSELVLGSLQRAEKT